VIGPRLGAVRESGWVPPCADAAHAGETILVAKDGKPWARLVPLETDRPWRQPGLLRGQLQLPSIDVLLAPLPPEELDALEAPLPWPEPEGRHVGLVRLQLLQDRPCLSVGLIGKALMPLR